MTKPVLKLFNSLTREKQIFTPIDPDNIGLYLCGVTPYDDSHIGHARGAVVFDVLFRLLRHVYGENHVTYVRNFTDIDDKIIERANELGVNPTDLAEQHIQGYHADLAALNTLPPTHEPRVSTSMSGIVAMVDELLTKNKAYVTASGDVMFDVPAFESTGGHSPFGSLARRTFDKLQARVEGDEEKRDPRDFPIWKANAKSTTKLEQAFHPQQLGATNPAFTAPGRPGWHIECSVMSKQHLGPTFDIHGGGEDLQFPHHCCEIAQSEALLPANTNMANIWMHNGFITVNGTKMSKSLGNFTTIKDALQKYSPEAIRLWLLQTHYRKPVDYSDEALQASMSAAQNLHEKLSWLSLQSQSANLHGSIRPEFTIELQKIADQFWIALNDDLNTSKALAQIFELLNFVRNFEQIKMTEYRSVDAVYVPMLEALGIQLTWPAARAYQPLNQIEERLYNARQEARAAKNWAESDRLRDLLKTEHNILVEDGPTGQTWRRL